MKSLKQHITEKLVLNSNTKVRNPNEFNYYPKTKNELRRLVEQLIEERGNEADFNDIDVSEITDMEELFAWLTFNGDISLWDVSKVENMSCMFKNSDFTGENGDISNWNVSNVEDMYGMFYKSKFKGDISKWDVGNAKQHNFMFDGCPIKEENKPKFKK